MGSNTSPQNEKQDSRHDAHNPQMLTQLDFPIASGTLEGDSGDNDALGVLDRSTFSTMDTIEYIWKELGLPEVALKNIHLDGSGLGLPSSFKIGHLAQSTIALSALGAALIYSTRTKKGIPLVRVPLQHAALEFKSERLYTLGDDFMQSPWSIGGIYKASDGYIRIHDAFPHHRAGALKLLGCDSLASREEVAKKVSGWAAIDLENEAIRQKLVIFAMRSFRQWDLLSAAKEVPDFPIVIRKIRSGPPSLPLAFHSRKTDKCLRGLRVLELSRVIAAPVCGRALAVHGADVLWITSPNLPDIPGVDRDMARGKRTIQLDLTDSSDVERIKGLASSADIFIQGYRPTSIAAKGDGSLTPEALSALNPAGLVYGSFSAWGPYGPWAERRGFDSLVQTATGLNIAEGEAFDGNAAGGGRPLPAQALDHAGGYFLATGILAALYRRATEGGSYEVSVSLASTGKYLRSLGQIQGRSGFDCVDPSKHYQEMVVPFLEARETEWGVMRALQHSATVEGLEVGYDMMPKALGSDAPEWLPFEN